MMKKLVLLDPAGWGDLTEFGGILDFSWRPFEPVILPPLFHLARGHTRDDPIYLLTSF